MASRSMTSQIRANGPFTVPTAVGSSLQLFFEAICSVIGVVSEPVEQISG